MKFEVIDNNSFQVRLNTSYKKINRDNQTDVIKNILLLIKKRYALNIYGFYEVNIYYIDIFVTIIKFKKLNNNDSFYNTIDLKIINHDKKINIEIDDFLLENNKNIYKMCEHYYIKKLNLHY